MLFTVHIQNRTVFVDLHHLHQFSIGLDDFRFEALDGVELCLGGAERVVTEENKMQYLAAGLEVWARAGAIKFNH